MLGDLAAEEREHAHIAEELERKAAPPMFAFKKKPPGAACSCCKSSSLVSPASSMATSARFAALRGSLRDTRQLGRVSRWPGCSIGAGISMGFAEALQDDGTLTGRGHPWIRGVVCGLMTTLGGIGHTLPYLIPNFHVATSVAVGVVVIELGVIAYIRNHYMDTPFLSAAFQVVVGGLLVFLAGILIGSA